MNKPWLSILIPSINPTNLARFLATLEQNTDVSKDEYQIIIDTEPADGIGEVFSRMIEKVQTEWVWVANDDLICEDPSWLGHFKQATQIHPDGVALIYPNDKLFEETFCCFPLVKLENIKDLFPMGYKKYKVDDCIMKVIPKNRYIYLENVVMRHLNFNVKEMPGFLTKSGNIYPIDQRFVDHDHALIDKSLPKLAKIRIANEKKAGIKHPDKKILVGCITAEYARRADFYDYYNAMIKPEGTVSTFAHGQSPAENRNIIIDQAFEVGATHIFFMDDDIVFKPSMMMDLLKHDVDIVTGLMFKRNYPHPPLIFDTVDDQGRCRHKALDPNEKGLVEIVACGLGCCLIKIKVFETIEKPFIRLGELDKSGWNDDIGFFKRVREAGFKLYCDLDVWVGHIASMIVWPDKQNDQWMTTYDTYGSGRVSAPQYVRPKSQELVENDSTT